MDIKCDNCNSTSFVNSAKDKNSIIFMACTKCGKVFKKSKNDFKEAPIHDFYKSAELFKSADKKVARFSFVENDIHDFKYLNKKDKIKEKRVEAKKDETKTKENKIKQPIFKKLIKWIRGIFS